MDYYCVTKFTDLQVHVQSRLIYNCCKAYPERVNLDWLESNPGKLFHTPTMLEDRKLMLENKPCSSCHFGCYKYEEQGLTSPRLQVKNKTRISETNSPLRDLQIALTNDCNLACVYCSPEWSSAWQREVEKHGEYTVDGQFINKNENWNQLWSKLKQKSRGTGSRFFSLLMREIRLAEGLRSITLLGGEPLLNNQLDEVLDNIKDKKITVITGLGVTDERLKKVLKKTKDIPVKFVISGESTGKFFEFIRYGLGWEDFKRRTEMINANNHKIEFISTISNLSVFSLNDFYRCYHKQYPIKLNLMSDRPFLEPHVLDPQSKENFLENAQEFGHEADKLSRMISPEPKQVDREKLKGYLIMLSHRRQLDLNFFPKHFLDWCGINT
jgi:organic radical activating enzyme